MKHVQLLQHHQFLIFGMQAAFWDQGVNCWEKIHKLSKNQTCTDLRATVSRHILPPISWWGGTVDSYRRLSRNSRTSHKEWGFSGTGKGPIPLGYKGGRRGRKMVTTIWCMFDSP